MELQRASTPTEKLLRQTLAAGAHSSGGWAYYAAKASRLEPTCWALLALGAEDAAVVPHRDFLARCQRPSGWLVEVPDWPVNISFNALAAFTWLVQPALSTEDMRRRLINALVGQKGVKAPPMEGSNQDNLLQGWSWIDATFSWVEPTAWALLALKAARRAGLASGATEARIAEAERLLINRVCRNGGWNFGNATVLGQALRPYVPTSALGLLALQDRRDDAAVVETLAYLEAHWRDEVSALSLGLSLIALDVYGQSVTDIETRLSAHVSDALAFGNLHAIAVALLALSRDERTHAFRL